MPSLAAANLDLSTCRQTSITAYKTAKVPASRSKKRSIKSSWPGLGKKRTAEQHKKHGGAKPDDDQKNKSQSQFLSQHIHPLLLPSMLFYSSFRQHLQHRL